MFSPRDRPVEVVVVVCPNPGSPGAPALNGIPPKREVADVVVAVAVVAVVVVEAVLATVARGVVVVAPNPAKLGTVVAVVVGADVAPRLPKTEAAVVVATAATVVVAVPVVTAAVVVAEPETKHLKDVSSAWCCSFLFQHLNLTFFVCSFYHCHAKSANVASKQRKVCSIINSHCHVWNGCTICCRLRSLPFFPLQKSKCWRGDHQLYLLAE